MSRGGLSKARLERMHEVMSGHVARGVVPGLVTAVSRRGEVHVDPIGTTAVGNSTPVRSDTIFRISSMTKPVTAVAALILVEECTLRLDDPVDDLLPELADRQVLRAIDGPLDDTVPAHRPITVRDLLTFRWASVGSDRPETRGRSWRRSTQQELERRPAATRRSRPRPTSGCAGSARCRSCTSPASGGCTTPAPTCSAC